MRDACTPSGEHAGRASFWVDLDNGTYEVRLYLRSSSARASRLDVYAEGEHRVQGLELKPALAGAECRDVEPATFEVDVRDGRLELDLVQAMPRRTAPWEWCAMVVRLLRGPQGQ